MLASTTRRSHWQQCLKLRKTCRRKTCRQRTELLERDPQLRARPAWLTLDHAALGAFEHQTTPYHLERTPGRPTAAPLLGEHSEHVCLQLLGLSVQRYRELREAGVFS